MRKVVSPTSGTGLSRIAGDDVEGVHVRGLALVGRHAGGGVALDVLDRAEAFARRRASDPWPSRRSGNRRRPFHGAACAILPRHDPSACGGRLRRERAGRSVRPSCPGPAGRDRGSPPCRAAVLAGGVPFGDAGGEIEGAAAGAGRALALDRPCPARRPRAPRRSGACRATARRDGRSASSRPT